MENPTIENRSRLRRALVFGAAAAPAASVDSAQSLCAHLAQMGAEALRSLSPQRVNALANELIDQLIEPSSEFWRDSCDLDQAAADTGLHPRTLIASLSLALTALRPGSVLEQLPSSADSTAAADPAAAENQPALAILAGNVPVLLLQVLLPALLTQRPMVIKLPSRGGDFQRSILGWLGAREQTIAQGVAALAWRGGANDAALERELLGADPGFGTVLVFGDKRTIGTYQDLVQAQRILTFGPKTSVALVTDSGDPAPPWLDRIARDIVLFEQNGCLSVAGIVLVAEDVLFDQRCQQLADSLEHAAAELPRPNGPGLETAGARQWIDAAHLSGNDVWGDLSNGGTVVRARKIEPSPLCRTVLAVQADSLEAGMALIKARQNTHGDLQGVALEGTDELQGGELRERLAALGISRVASAGRLQAAGLSWRNGGVDLLAELGSITSRSTD